MATYTGLHIAASGLTFRAFPASQDDFANWASLKVAFTEAGSTGKYSATLNDTNGLLWLVFQSDTQPTLFSEAVAQIDLDGSIAAIKADAALGTADGGLVANAAMLGVAIDGYTFTEAQRLMLAAMVGPITGGGTGTNVIKGADESKARITGTYDNLGNRTPTIIDAT